eukprot:1160219-Pelagomonas_calceolata.AAC.2
MEPRFKGIGTAFDSKGRLQSGRFFCFSFTVDWLLGDNGVQLPAHDNILLGTPLSTPFHDTSKENTSPALEPYGRLHAVAVVKHGWMLPLQIHSRQMSHALSRQPSQEKDHQQYG